MTLELLQPPALVSGEPGAPALLALGLLLSVRQLLRRAADIGRDRGDRRLLRRMVGAVLGNHPDGALAHLGREFRGLGQVRHGSSLSRAGASGKPGAVQTAFGQPVSSKGFGSGFMAVKIDKAGLPKRCKTHGLRKAAARRLAEAGCTANEIAAITGHATLQEVSRYTKAAEQKKLAQSAMRRLSPEEPRSDSQTTPRGLGLTPKKHNEISGGSEAWWSRPGSNR